MMPKKLLAILGIMIIFAAFWLLFALFTVQELLLCAGVSACIAVFGIAFVSLDELDKELAKESRLREAKLEEGVLESNRLAVSLLLEQWIKEEYL